MRNAPTDATAMRLGHFGGLKAVQGNQCLTQQIMDFSAVWRFAPSVNVLKAHDMQNAPADALAMIFWHLGELKAVKVHHDLASNSWMSVLFGVLDI